MSMSTLHERLLDVCRDLGIKSPIGRDIERIAGVSSGRVTQIKQERDAARPGEETIARLSRLGYAVDWIREGKGPRRAVPNVSSGPDIRGRVPLISWVQAGAWNEVAGYDSHHADTCLPILQNGDGTCYALRVEGDSMTASYGKTYPDGTIIIVNPGMRSPVSGQRVIAKLRNSNQVTFKVFVEEDGRRWLKPLNGMHPSIHDDFSVIGTVVEKYEID